MENRKEEILKNIYTYRYILWFSHTLLLAFLWYIIMPMAPYSILMIPIYLIMIWCNIISFSLTITISYDLTIKFIKYIINKTIGRVR